MMPTSQLFDPNMAKRHPISILLVDDNIINLKVASRMLARMGYEVDQATNGLEALQAQQESRYDLIFMDIQMPEMDGVTATKHIIQKYADKRPRIVAVTAHAMKGDRERYLEAGMDGYISKPVQVDRLIEEIEVTPCKGAGTNSTQAEEMAADSQDGEQANTADLSAPIDFNLFADMLGMTLEDVDEILPELVELFITDSHSQIDMIENAIKTGDYTQLKTATHKMKGGSASIAATDLSKTCGELEKMGVEQQLEPAQAMFKKAKQQFQEIETWLAGFQAQSKNNFP